ncbi:response regulator [Mesosutterella sp. OilRF-GAM-744-9]|uniref:Response regulator n=1 Tax=Mesosutterella porci TaxID=2915351 RepID=A0ABS9MQX2_9BURK|nr:response regulator [Mesosutterella sp. oilRF-744-WT-GAM-9]MCG5030787.1 response regulator [Mesosutterella sp. oilRF-744-WT-GAM-9]MCI6530753.1 response regulator [Mesosutterella sp.]
MKEEDRKRVLVRIVDDDPDVREAESFMLDCKGWRTRSYDSARAFLVGDAASIPGCLVLDIRMPGMSGIELQAEMRRRGYTLPIIFLTGHADVDSAVKTLRRGAADFLQKPVENARLLESIERCCDLSLAAARGELSGGEASRALSEMSAREKQVTGLIAQGVSNREIASRLGLSERTVQGHRNNIYRKLRVHNEEGFLECLRRAADWKRDNGLD